MTEYQRRLKANEFIQYFTLANQVLDKANTLFEDLSDDGYRVTYKASPASFIISQKLYSVRELSASKFEPFRLPAPIKFSHINEWLCVCEKAPLPSIPPLNPSQKSFGRGLKAERDLISTLEAKANEKYQNFKKLLDNFIKQQEFNHALVTNKAKEISKRIDDKYLKNCDNNERDALATELVEFVLKKVSLTGHGAFKPLFFYDKDRRLAALELGMVFKTLSSVSSKPCYCA